MHMVLLGTTDNAVTAAAVIAERLPKTLSKTAVQLYKVLVATAVETAKARGYSPTVTHVSLHMPLEVLADVCGIHRVTAWRHLPALRELGLIDFIAHKGTLRGETRNTGTLFEVRLNPTHGTKAKLNYHEKKHKWRDLDKDVKRKRTAHRQLKDRKEERLQQSVKTTPTELEISRLLEWTLPPHTLSARLSTDGCKGRQATLETLLDVTAAPKDGRNKMVELAAQALSQALADQNSVSWYQKLLWQLLRRFDATGDDHSYQVYLMAQRARTDSLEGFARRPGALFTSRLKQAPWFDEVMRGPPVRVSTYRADLHSRSDLRQAAALKPLPVVVGVRVDRQGALPA
jgi:hypothetical protein